MTPLDVSRGIAAFLKRRIKTYDEMLYIFDDKTQTETKKDIRVYSGFLPRKTTRKEMQELCPAIVVRPESVVDGKEDTKASIIIYVTVYDEDMEHGCDTLFHLLEFVRMNLLSENPVDDKWYIADGMSSSVPDEQPYPQWIGIIEFDVFVPQPKRYNTDILAR